MKTSRDTPPSLPWRFLHEARACLHTCRGKLKVVQVPAIEFDGVPLDLPRQQIRLLLALLEASGPLTTTELAKRAWDGAFVLEHTVHCQVAILRKSIADLGIRIHTLRGRGYVITATVQTSEPSETAPQIDLR
jgi:DNA-binding winged helix-turn-helix (wHTH) protein